MNKEISRDRVFIRKSDRSDYKLLQEQEFFNGRTNKELFMMAMTIGFHEGSPMNFKKGEKDGFFLLKDLNDEEKSLFYSIAAAEKDLNVLSNEDEVYTICEEYANCGIKLLKEKISSGEFGSFIKRFETELLEMIKKQKK